MNTPRVLVTIMALWLCLGLAGGGSAAEAPKPYAPRPTYEQLEKSLPVVPTDGEIHGNILLPDKSKGMPTGNCWDIEVSVGRWHPQRPPASAVATTKAYGQNIGVCFYHFSVPAETALYLWAKYTGGWSYPRVSGRTGGGAAVRWGVPIGWSNPITLKKGESVEKNMQLSQ